MAETVQFDLVNQAGETVSSDDLAGKKYVMFFYPRAMTPGCTTESCDFRDSYSEFNEAGYEVVASPTLRRRVVRRRLSETA